MSVGLVTPITRCEEKSLSDKWVESSTKRAVRDTLCHAGDNIFRLNASNPFVMQLGQKFAPINKNAVGYDKLIGIRQDIYKNIGRGKNFDNFYSFFQSYDGKNIFYDHLKGNLKGFMNPLTCQGVTTGDFVKNTLVKDNLKSFVSPITEGKICSSLLKSSFAGLTLWGVISKTRKNYSKEKSAKKAFFTFCKESFKSLFIWEAGSIGFILGRAIMPVGILASVAGILGVSLASALSYKAVNKIIS